MSLMSRLGAVVAACACGCAAGPASAGALPSSDRPVARAASATAVSVARLAPRSGQAFGAWSPTADQYRRSYVYPDSWKLLLNGCGSLVDGKPIGLTNGQSPFWVLQPLDGQTADGRPLTAITVGPEPNPGTTCRRSVELRALGRWRITVTVVDSAGVPASAVSVKTFRDVLIAAVGDSFASGEGGKTRVGEWADKQCDRSMTPWPFLLAESLEDSSTTVTYLNYACSGAEVSQLTTKTYRGMNDPGSRFPALKPQIWALRDRLGDPLNPTTRPVNLLVVAVGINEMGGSGVADVLMACVNLSVASRLVGLDVDCKQDLSGDVARLSDLYDEVEVAASARLKLGRMHVIGYPARFFTNSNNDFTSCGVFSGMDGSETRWVTDTVNEVNREIALASLRNGWSFTATADIFARHGYCADHPAFQRWFHTPSESYWRQGDINGTIHPTKSGHRATAKRVRRTVRLDVPVPSPQRVTVRFLRVRVRHEGPLDWTRTVSLGVSGYQGACGNQTRALVLTLNEWKDVSADPCSRYDITTVGRTLRVSGLIYLFRPTSGEPEEPPVPPGGHPPLVARADPASYFPVGKLHRRRDVWDATSPNWTDLHPPARRRHAQDHALWGSQPGQAGVRLCDRDQRPVRTGDVRRPGHAAGGVARRRASRGRRRIRNIKQIVLEEQRLLRHAGFKPPPSRYLGYTAAPGPPPPPARAAGLRCCCT